MKVLTLGTFDCFHRGHTQLLKRCRDLGHVTVALNTDRFIHTYKGQPPIHDYAERKAVLDACRYVDKVVSNPGGDKQPAVILEAGPDIIVIGSDWLERDYLTQLGITPHFLRSHLISLMYVPYTDGISTTEIRRRVANQTPRNSDRHVLQAVGKHPAPDPSAVHRILA